MHRRTLSVTTPHTNTIRGRFLILAGLTILITLVYIFTPRSIIPTTITGHYPYVRPPTPQLYTPTPDPPSATPAPEQVIVKVQLQGEDLNWLLDLLPTWRNQVITIDASFAHLHAGAHRVDKGRIADAYLRWLVTNYNNLPATMVFIPPRAAASQQHDDTQMHDNDNDLVQRIRDLQVPHIQTAGFAALDCTTRKQCEDDAISPFRNPPDEFRTLEVKMAKAWEGIFNSSTVPERIASPIGNAFAVSKDQVRNRGVEAYERVWRWVAQTKMDDESAGAVVERVWHVLFGREGVWCPGEEGCGCEVFGRC